MVPAPGWDFVVKIFRMNVRLANILGSLKCATKIVNTGLRNDIRVSNTN